MPNKFHQDFTGDDNHALTSATYADIAARDADTAFQVTKNIDKMVRVEDASAFFTLFSVVPVIWVEHSPAQVGLDPAIHALLSDSLDQEPTDTNPTVIKYTTQDDIVGLTHSTTVNPGEITIEADGTYLVSPQPQVGKDSGGTAQTFDMFMQVDRGSGFVDEANSNIKLTIKDSDVTDVIVSMFTVDLEAGDKLRMMQRVSSSSVGLGLKATAAETGPPTIPATPSIIFTMSRIRGVIA